MAALSIGSALVSLALVAAQSGDGGRADDVATDATSVDPEARMHAEAACDLTSKAGQAAEASEVDERSRYAAAVLLLDRAIIESARAAESDTGLADLDTALQAVHAAGHEGDPDGWQVALDDALTECRSAMG